jgi:hypothetical protein
MLYSDKELSTNGQLETGHAIASKNGKNYGTIRIKKKREGKQSSDLTRGEFCQGRRPTYGKNKTT